MTGTIAYLAGRRRLDLRAGEYRVEDELLQVIWSSVASLVPRGAFAASFSNMA